MYVRGKSKHSANTITERIQSCIARYPPEAPFCTPIMNLREDKVTILRQTFCWIKRNCAEIANTLLLEQ